MRQRYDIFGVSILALSISIESTYAACTANSPTYYCASGYYGTPTSASGTCTACPAAQHGGTVGSDRATTKTGCYERYTPDNCSAGLVKSYYSSTGIGTYSSNTTRVSALTPISGYYVASATATSCTQCPPSDHMGWTVGSNATASTYGPINNCFIAGTPVGCSSGSAKMFYCNSADGYCDLHGISGPYPPKSGYYNTSTLFASPVCTACPTADSGWTAYTSTNPTSWSACYETRTPEGCAYGLVKRQASSASSYSTTTTLYSSLGNLDGYFVDGTTCVECPYASNSYLDSDYMVIARGTSELGEASVESDCYLDSAETYYDETGSFQLTNNCPYDSVSSEDLL